MESLRVQSKLDCLGLDKNQWIEEIHRKYNILCLLNYAFRECIMSFYNTEMTSLSSRRSQNFSQNTVKPSLREKDINFIVHVYKWNEISQKKEKVD